jgi:hypothetical protein
VLQGSIEEKIYSDALTLKESHVLETNDVSFMNDMVGLYSIENKGDIMAVSLYVYSPFKHETKFFI